MVVTSYRTVQASLAASSAALRSASRAATSTAVCSTFMAAAASPACGFCKHTEQARREDMGCRQAMPGIQPGLEKHQLFWGILAQGFWIPGPMITAHDDKNAEVEEADCSEGRALATAITCSVQNHCLSCAYLWRSYWHRHCTPMCHSQFLSEDGSLSVSLPGWYIDR